MNFEKVFKALNRARVKYVVAGGVAVVLHGYRRHTDDLDLIVFLQKENLGKLFDAMKSIGYMPKVPVLKEQFVDTQTRERWKKEKGMIVFSFVETQPPFNLIDIFVDEPIKFGALYKKKVSAKLGKITVPVISIDHLIKLKQIAGRDRDLNDIAQLEEIKSILGRRASK